MKHMVDQYGTWYGTEFSTSFDDLLLSLSKCHSPLYLLATNPQGRYWRVLYWIIETVSHVPLVRLQRNNITKTVNKHTIFRGWYNNKAFWKKKKKKTSFGKLFVFQFLPSHSNYFIILHLNIEFFLLLLTPLTFFFFKHLSMTGDTPYRWFILVFWG